MYNGQHNSTEDSNLSEYEEKLLEVSLDEEGCENLAVRRGERKFICRKQGKRRIVCEPAGGEGGTGENFSRSSSFRRGVSGLVRRVSQRVGNSNKGEQYITRI